MERLMFIGMLLIIIGIVFVIISGIAALNNSNRAEFAFGGFIGPIPFGFFTSKKMFWAWLGILIAGIVLWILGRRIVG